MAGTGVALKEGTCFWNKRVQGPSGCVQPCPPLHPRNIPIWHLFKKTYGAARPAGMSGIHGARALSDVAEAARASHIPWDQWTLDKILLIEGFYLEDLAKQAESESKKSKKGKP